MNETLQELLQERAAAVDAQAALVDRAEAEGRELTPEEEAEFDKYEAKIAELDEKIEAKRKHEERVAAVRARQNQATQPATKPLRPETIYDFSVQKERLDDGGFKSLGEFLHALRFGDPKGRIHSLEINKHGQEGGVSVPDAFKAQLLRPVRAEWRMGDGEKGGFAVPTQFDPEVRMIQPEQEVVMPRAMVIPAGDPPDASITVPALSQGENGALGGVVTYWIEENAEKPETDASLRSITLTPHENAAHTVVSDKLLANWQAAETFISNLLRLAVIQARDLAFIKGDGVGKPLGYVKSDGAVKINRATASDVTFADISSMIAAMIPDALPGAEWVISQSAMAKIIGLKDDAGNSIFIRGDITRGIPDTLAGLPVRWTGRAPTLGQLGDVALVNLAYYLIKLGSGPFIAASPHVRFTKNQTVIKVVSFIDGKPWVDKPLTLDDGVTKVSPFVLLDVPAGS